jgi:hypothetical protein
MSCASMDQVLLQTTLVGKPMKGPGGLDKTTVSKLSFFFFFFCGTGAWTQGLHLQPLHQPFFLC